MNVGALRALVLQVNGAAFGVAATIALETGDVQTTAIWLTTTTEGYPAGQALHRREGRQVIAVPIAAVSELPRGTVITAPPPPGSGDSDPREWRVDGIAEVAADQIRAVVIPNA